MYVDVVIYLKLVRQYLILTLKIRFMIIYRKNSKRV